MSDLAAGGIVEGDGVRLTLGLDGPELVVPLSRVNDALKRVDASGNFEWFMPLRGDDDQIGANVD